MPEILLFALCRQEPDDVSRDVRRCDLRRRKPRALAVTASRTDQEQWDLDA